MQNPTVILKVLLSWLHRTPVLDGHCVSLDLNFWGIKNDQLKPSPSLQV